jgi:hypothetical protein
MNLLLRVTIVLSGMLALSAAAESTASTAKIRLLAFARAGDDMETRIVDPDGNPMAKDPVALPTQQLSAVESVPGRKLVFTSKTDVKRILGKVNLPAEGGEFVLVFLPAPSGSPALYHVDAVSLPESGFGSGDYAFVNYSGSPVGCDIAGKRMVVPQGKAAVYPAAQSQKDGGNRSIVCYSQKDGAWESTPFFSSRIIVQEGVRNLVLIGRDPRTGQIDFRGIPDFLERPTQ